MDFNLIIFAFIGGFFGILLRIFIQQNPKIKKGIYINRISLVNFLASFFLGILVALEINDKNLVALFYIGFLGCLSTFSSFIYQLFILLKRRRIKDTFFHFLKVLIVCLLLFYLGFYLIKNF